MPPIILFYYYFSPVPGLFDHLRAQFQGLFTSSHLNPPEPAPATEKELNPSTRMRRTANTSYTDCISQAAIQNVSDNVYSKADLCQMLSYPVQRNKATEIGGVSPLWVADTWCHMWAADTKGKYLSLCLFHWIKENIEFGLLKKSDTKLQCGTFGYHVPQCDVLSKVFPSYTTHAVPWEDAACVPLLRFWFSLLWWSRW